jgi:hypothetical protein
MAGIQAQHFVQRSQTLKFINKTGKLLSTVGLDPFKLDSNQLLQKARSKAGTEAYTLDQMKKGLSILIDSINREAKPNSFGRLAAKTLFERTLIGRYKVEQHLRQHPEIEQTEISKPIFIIGMPRTGTTILHALLNQDPQNRSPLAWECLIPHPVPQLENYEDNAQVNSIKKEFEQLFKLVPDFKKKHYLAATEPQECLGITALDFTSFQPMAQFYTPSYLQWFSNEADQLSTMRWHKRFLQYLGSGGVIADRWLLKTPVHLNRLKELFQVYPDACVIMTHRDPKKVIPSAASLVSTVRSLYSDHEDPHQTGREQNGVWSQYLSSFVEDRKALQKEDQIIDLRFEDFVSDHMSVVQRIYDKFNLSLSPEAKNNMQQFLAKNPKDKHGAHTYTLEDFGVSEAQIKNSFEGYYKFLDQL